MRALSPTGLSDVFSVELWVQTTVDSLNGTQTYQGTGLVWSDVGGTADTSTAGRAIANALASVHVLA